MVRAKKKARKKSAEVAYYLEITDTLPPPTKRKGMLHKHAKKKA